jgi:hypothetical protein
MLVRLATTLHATEASMTHHQRAAAAYRERVTFKIVVTMDNIRPLPKVKLETNTTLDLRRIYPPAFLNGLGIGYLNFFCP